MSQELRNLIEAYVAAVARCAKWLQEAGVSLPGSAAEWSMYGPWRGTLEGGARFQKHGIGCSVHAEGVTTDFDFGPHGETDGFDAWRLFGFAADHGMAIPYKTHRELDAHLSEAERAREVVRLPNSTLFRLSAP